MSKKETNNLSVKYQKKTDREHILDAPDTYIGSIEKDEIDTWVLNEESSKIEYKKISYVPGKYKCFDEGIVNVKDHYTRMLQLVEEKGEKNNEDFNKPNYLVKNIDICINKENGSITMINDGNGIDVAKHPEHDIWIPEMIFGHLRTSTNYKKDEKKIVGGKNGFGFKLVLIWSEWGKIETIDHMRGLKYVQEFKNNLSEICKPKITKYTGKPYTKVSWLPDYKRFGIENIDDNLYSLLARRVYDIAALTNKDVKVKLNSKIIPIKSFEQYINMYVGNKNETKRVYEKSNDRWEYAVCLTPQDEFCQVSFVNGIYTSKGGKHIDYILNQITKKVIDVIEKKKKVKVKPTSIKEQLMLFVNCVIENPSFDSQTKDYLTTSSTKFGSTCKISDSFIDKIIKLGIMEQALSITEVKTTKEAKKTDGKKQRNVRGIPKLIDANMAGTIKSDKCTLILCEGDSAKAGIVSGLSKEDRNYIGVYPLKGKLMNVRDVTIKRMSENNEINELKQILGLELNKKYKTIDDVHKSLRYGKILFMTDQDLDGTHIKGLGINLFDSVWKDLIELDTVLGFMNTPILKAKKNNKEKSFYNEKEYEEWKESLTEKELKSWTIKYYKGLGTSTSKEFKEYFKEKKIVDFKYNGKTDHDTLDMVFNKKRAEDRKEWLSDYNKNASMDTNKLNVSYSEFINLEMKHFSKYDCERSIPNVIDGLKTSLRKILYSAFKRNLTKEIKVAQFGGYVSEHSGYHHGEMSLMKAIVGMAQDYVGSNNINLFMPEGQFGTRLAGGDDSASERYIFTYLNPITKTIFNKNDNSVLNYLYDDGQSIEPEFYVPIIPMILVNGSKGIGTGFSTEILSYNPIQIIEFIQEKLKSSINIEYNKREINIEPYYQGFKGQIICIEKKKNNPIKYLIKGCYKRLNNFKIEITELPIGTWTDNYKAFLEKCMNNDTNTNSTTKTTKTNKTNKKITPIIKEYKDLSTDTNVNIIIDFYDKSIIDKLENEKVKDLNGHVNGLEKYLNLYTTKTTTNMHLFNHEQKLKKYKNIYEIIDNHYIVRLEYYEKRKDQQLNTLEKEKKLLSNKARFIKMQCDEELDLRRKKKDVVVKLLKSHNFDIIDEDEEYKYLRSMPIDSVIEENIQLLIKQAEQKKYEYDTLKNKSIPSIWMEELDELMNIYNDYKLLRKRKQNDVLETDDNTIIKPTKPKIKKNKVHKYNIILEK